MVSNGNDPSQGAPLFPPTDAPDDGEDQNELARYAAFRGTRMYGTNAEMEAFESAGYARPNELWVNTTDGITYLYASGWKKWESDEVAFTPTFTGITIGNGASGASYRYSSGLIFLHSWIKFGSTTTIGGSGVKLQLPVNADGSTSPPFDAGFSAYVNRGGVFFGPLSAPISTVSEVDILALSTSGPYAGLSVLSMSVPGTWGDGALLSLAGLYRPVA